MFSCVNCPKRAELKCSCGSRVFCIECFDNHADEIKRANLPRPMHVCENITLMLSEENWSKVNSKISKRVRLLEQCKEMIMKQARALINTIESSVVEAYDSLEYQIFCLLNLIKGKSFTHEQANEIEKFMKSDMTFNAEFDIEIKSAIVDCFRKSFLSENGESNENCCLIKTVGNEPGEARFVKIDWPKLETLDLSTNRIGVAGAESLVKANWPNLKSINLANNSIGEVGAAHLIKSNWQNLQKLDLSDNSIGEGGVSHLIKASWPNLQTLSLWQNSIGDDGAAHLIKSNWPNLITLNLRENSIGEAGAAHLIKANWMNLQKLELEENSIGEAGASHLIKSIWPNLKELYLGANSIRDDGAKYLLSRIGRICKYSI